MHIVLPSKSKTKALLSEHVFVTTSTAAVAKGWNASFQTGYYKSIYAPYMHAI
jgi:hypothetical protein